MATIFITDSVRLHSDTPLNWTLEKKRIVSDEKSKRYGEVDWDSIGYYSSPKDAAQALLRRHLDLLLGDKKTVMTLKQLINAVDEGAELIAQACQNPAK